MKISATLLREAREERKGRAPRRRPLKTTQAKPAITKEMVAKGQKPPNVSWKDWLAAGGTFGGMSKLKPHKPSKPHAKKKGSPLPHLSPYYHPKPKYRLVVGEKDVVSRWKRRWGKPTKDAIYNALVALAKEGKPINRKVHKAFVVDKGGKVVAQAKNLEIPGGKNFGLLSLAGGDDWDDWDDEPPAKKAKPMGHWLGGKWSSKKHKPKPVIELTPEEKRLDKIVRKMREPLERTAAGGVVFQTFQAANMWDLPVLVTQTAAKYGSRWVFPKGGLDPGETLRQGAAREVLEEAGVKAKVAGSHAYVSTSTFHDLGKYDIPVVMAAARKAVGNNKDDLEFVESQKQALCRKFYKWQNETHYFVMKYMSGEPDPTHVHGAEAPECTNKHPTAEMQDAKWVPLKKAVTMDARMLEVIKGLRRTIEENWKTPKGVEKTKPMSMSSLRGMRKPRQINPKNPKPHTGKYQPPTQTGLAGFY